MININNDDILQAATIIEEEYEIDIYKDIIFSQQLNAYFNFNVNEEIGEITFSFEVDEGGAEFVVTDYFDECLISCNDVARKYIKRIDMEPLDLLTDF